MYQRGTSSSPAPRFRRLLQMQGAAPQSFLATSQVRQRADSATSPRCICLNIQTRIILCAGLRRRALDTGIKPSSAAPRALDAADEGLMQCLGRRRRPAQREPGSGLLRQMQRGLVAEFRWRTDSSRGTTAARRRHLRSVRDEAQGWRKFPFRIHGARAQRDGQPRSEDGIEARRAGPQTGSGPGTPSTVYLQCRQALAFGR